MIRILIVEDDVLTRIGITSMIKSSGREFCVVGEAGNGQEALKLARQKKPDIIITDISMPVMNGIELIRRAREEGIGARFVILSAYSDFQYVREGMLLGAEDYLLKLELEQDKLAALLLKIGRENGSQDSASSPAAYREPSKSLCIYNIITGKYVSRSELLRAIEETRLNLPENNLILVAIQRTFSQNVELAAQHTPEQILTFLEGMIKNYGKCYGSIVDNDLFCFAVSLPHQVDSAEYSDFCERACREITEYTRNTLGVELLAAVSEPLDRYEDLARAFESLCRFHGGRLTLDPGALNAPADAGYSFASELSFIDTVLQTNAIDQIDASFQALLDSLASFPTVPSKVMHGICYTLIHLVDRFLSKNAYIENNWKRSDDLIYLVKKCRTPNDYIAYIKSLQNRLNNFLRSEKDYKSAVMKAMQYIERHYSDNLSLEEVAAEVHLNPTYLSRIFSQETGCSFIAYLTATRMKIAKELLATTDKKLQEISDLIGYNNANYFCRIFKKEVQLTPIEYRRKTHKARNT